jgi:uncharacterized integral membrane protein (TIGR00698 family)
MKPVKMVLFIVLAILCGFPFINASIALAAGFLFSIVIQNPFKENAGAAGGKLLKASVIGLGFGINLQALLGTGKDSVVITTLFVLGALAVGLLVGWFFKVEKITSILISVGTAICGGSAIAAVGSILKANSNELSIATSVVFLLNALALFIFPSLGNYFQLSQEQFGTWAAIAIHDTSSVVGASTKYGDTALKIASVTKMLRIIWIIPVSLILVFGLNENRESFKIPLFIIGFLIASFIHSFVKGFDVHFYLLYRIAKQGLVISLFIIGSSISLETIKTVGRKVFLHAVFLWIIVSIASLLYIKHFT